MISLCSSKCHFPFVSWFCSGTKAVSPLLFPHLMISKQGPGFSVGAAGEGLPQALDWCCVLTFLVVHVQKWQSWCPYGTASCSACCLFLMYGGHGQTLGPQDILHLGPLGCCVNGAQVLLCCGVQPAAQAHMRPALQKLPGQTAWEGMSPPVSTLNYCTPVRRLIGRGCCPAQGGHCSSFCVAKRRLG